MAHDPDAHDPDPTRDNSSLALGRLRSLLRDLPESGDRKLPTERALAESLGISRRSVRRALEVLEAEGRVWRRQGAGTFAGQRPETATDLPSGDPTEVMEARLRIEPQIAQLAALRATPEALARMAELLERLEAVVDADSRELWDSAFHREIARAAGNRFLLSVFEALDQSRHDPVWRTLRERARRTADMRRYGDQHRAILEAIAARDPVRAGQAMRDHIAALSDSLARLTSLEALEDAV